MKLSTSSSSLGPLQLDSGLRPLMEPHILPWPFLGTWGHTLSLSGYHQTSYQYPYYYQTSYQNLTTKWVSPVSQQFSSKSTAQAPVMVDWKIKNYKSESLYFLDFTFFLALLHHEEHLLMKHRPWQLWRTPRRRRVVYFIMLWEKESIKTKVFLRLKQIPN